MSGGYILADHNIDRLIGEVLEVVEILGLSQGQETAIKDSIKKRVRDVVRDHKYIVPEITTIVHDMAYAIEYEQDKRAIASAEVSENGGFCQTPRYPIKGEYEISFTEVEE